MDRTDLAHQRLVDEAEAFNRKAGETILVPVSKEAFRRAIDDAVRELGKKDEASRREQKAGLQELHGVVIGETGDG